MVTFESSRPRFRSTNALHRRRRTLIKSLMILVPPIYRLSNFKLSTGLPWLERARVEQNTWENNDLTKDRVSTSSSLPVDCLTNLTRAQPPTLRSNFQQNGARRERMEGKGYFVWLGEKRRERKKERKTKERRGKKWQRAYGLVDRFL